MPSLEPESLANTSMPALEPTTPHKPTTPSKVETSAKLVLGQVAEVVIVSVTGVSHFYVNLYEVVPSLDRMRQELNTYCASSACKGVNQANLCGGSVVLAKFSLDQEWYRASIVAITPDKIRCQVCFTSCDFAVDLRIRM